MKENNINKNEIKEEIPDQTTTGADEKESINKDTSAIDGEENNCTKPAEESCGDDCTCGKCKESEKKDAEQSSKDCDRHTFFDELNALVKKFGGHIVGHHSSMIGGPLPYIPEVPRCANADTCEHADECPYATEEPEEIHTDHSSEYADIIERLESINRRLTNIEIAVRPTELKSEIQSGTMKFKGVKIRKKDIKKIRKAVLDVVEEALEDYEDSVIATMRIDVSRQVQELKNYISRVNSANVMLASKCATDKQNDEACAAAAIETPQKNWTLNDWLRFQTQLNQHTKAFKGYSPTPRDRDRHDHRKK